jgi:hypothetical protein
VHVLLVADIRRLFSCVYPPLGAKPSAADIRDSIESGTSTGSVVDEDDLRVHRDDLGRYDIRCNDDGALQQPPQPTARRKLRRESLLVRSVIDRLR